MNEQQLDIKFGEPVRPEFDYTQTLEQLDAALTEQVNLFHQKKRGSLTLECAMLGYALDLADFSVHNLDIELDFTEESLPKLVEIVKMMRENYAEEKPTEDVFDTWVKMSSGFLGSLMVRNLGAFWIDSSVGPAAVVNGTAAFIVNRLIGVITGEDGDETAVREIYEYLKTKNEE